MDSVDAAATATTVSSSGIENSDVTIFRQESLSGFALAIENVLEARNYKVAVSLCAGRLLQENLISCARHAIIKIILLNKSASDSFQKSLEGVDEKKLDDFKSLIFYKPGFNVKYLKKRFKRIIKIKMSDSPDKVANLIDLLIRLNKSCDGVKPYQIKNRFIEILVHSVLNPSVDDELHEMPINECKVNFSNQFGNFSHFQVNKFECFVNASAGFNLSLNNLSQTTSGNEMAKNWLSSRSVCDATTQLPPHENTEARTGQWLVECEQSISSENPFDKYAEILHKHLSEFDSRFAFFLISNRLSASDFLSGVANIPWLRVFDFDSKSREDGLLSAVEQLIKVKYNFTISTMSDFSQTLSERALNWLFLVGTQEGPNTLRSEAPYMWYCNNKQLLENHGTEIANFCACRYMPVFVIMWYNASETDTQRLDLLLSVFFPYFTSKTLTSKILIFVDKLPDMHDPLHPLLSKFQLKDCIFEVPLDCLCNWLSNAKVSTSFLSSGIRLPKATSDNDSSNFVDISQDHSWIQQHIEVLPVSSSQIKGDTATENVGSEFVKGGLATWNDLAHAKAVERDKQKSVYEKLRTDLLSDRKTITSFRILHTPGGGGTTFARQLLWYLHNDVPCGVVIPQPTFLVTPLLEIVNFLYAKTDLPVVLLVDGRSDYEVEQLYENCKYTVVILHVQRCNTAMPKNELTKECLLFETVSEKEAKKLAYLYSKFAPTKRAELFSLVADLHYKEKHLFEFGLTAFNLEYKGVQAYVRGYLTLPNSAFDALKKLTSWQKVVSYLSLVLYYSQGGLHKEVFHHLLKRDLYSFVTIKDLGYSGQQFVLETNGEWKINYFAVAKEILEQVLSGSTKSSSNKLSKAALHNLPKLVFDFIQMIKCAMGNNQSEHVFQQLSNVILRRNYMEMDVSDVYEKRPSYSHLLEDMPDDESRIKILESLTNAFPTHHEFHAHLGRMLNLMGHYERAEVFLDNALQLRIAERKLFGSDRPDNVRGRFHHMFGYACLRRAKHHLKFRCKKSSVNLNSAMKIIKKAVHHFTEGRKYASHNRSYGYMGEVRARLLIAKYVHDSPEFPAGCVEAFNGILNKKNLELSEFIRQSHYICDRLMAECQRYTPEAEHKGIHGIHHSTETFVECYKSVAENQEVWDKSELDISVRRGQITSLKTKYFRRNSRKTPSVDDITTKTDAEMVVKFYEDSIHGVLFGSYHSNSISLDVLEWLEAIRHSKIKKSYTISKVIHIVETWEKRNEVGYAAYYLYILNFLLAIYHPGWKSGQECNQKSVDLRLKLESNKFRQINTRLTREFLACHDEVTIRKLVCRNKLGSWDKETRFWKDQKVKKQLQVCTGIILKSAHKLKGVIKMDVSNPKINVCVNFYPTFYKLVGRRFADQSTPVEFFIGFNVERGAEAYCIRQLKQKFCNFCNLNTKVITLNQIQNGICAKCKRPAESNP